MFVARFQNASRRLTSTHIACNHLRVN